MESRIHGDVYVRFGGERLETCSSNRIRRWALILHERKSGR
ncbi:TraG family conjugative transposon ATPase, partial [Bacillus pseudomycoides]